MISSTLASVCTLDASASLWSLSISFAHGILLSTGLFKLFSALLVSLGTFNTLAWFLKTSGSSTAHLAVPAGPLQRLRAHPFARPMVLSNVPTAQFMTLLSKLAMATFLSGPLSLTTSFELIVSRLGNPPVILPPRSPNVTTTLHLASVSNFERRFATTIRDFDFKPGSLVLVLNKKVQPASHAKCKPRYFGPMVVISCSQNGSYHLAEVDGTVSKLKFVTFCLIPYFPWSLSLLEVTQFVNPEDLAGVAPVEDEQIN
ncbi:hypothetical protein SCLCIDRAFT_34427 [Scleroderma citrinum Foug A]|uniref:Uncharacterized protein n=1 Tax=Scleroderma citrinum Foug A TaxID=1036808 RepID=A0A0C3CNW2_9AGAM|nr:hypothetical protein SCLCIDRAFT_34427 [Scleroderma citrinum Foug A]